MTSDRSTTANSYTGAVVALLAVAVLWSINGSLIKLLHEGPDGVSGVAIAFYRSLLGGVALLPFVLGRSRRLGHLRPGQAIVSVATFTLMTLCFVVATTWTASANAIVLQYTACVWVFLLSWLVVHERPGPVDAGVLVLAMGGVSIIFFGHPTSELPALAVALASGLGYGALTVTLRALRQADPILVSCLNCIGSAVILLGFMLAWGRFEMTGRQWALMIFLGTFQLAVPYVLFSWALQRIEAPRATLIVLLETILNPIWTYLIIGESVPTATLLGAPLIVAGAAVFVLRRPARAPESVSENV